MQQALAQQTLQSFFFWLNQGAMAALLTSMAVQPTSSRNGTRMWMPRRAALLQRGCETNGLLCMKAATIEPEGH